MSSLGPKQMPSGPKAKKSGPKKDVLSGAGLKALVGKIEPLARLFMAPLNLELVALETPLENGRRIVRVVVDHPGTGPGGSKVTIDECTQIARQLSAKLDELEPDCGPAYVLEVSSPGLDRRLVTEADFRRFSGCLAKIKMIKDGRTIAYLGRLSTSEGDFKLITSEGDITFGLSPELKARLIPEM
ncbi:MAG: ribosome maturation factor RimP [Deltaproteobacteria bacterium]|jgi:ribosome maturation factor RimP|nr:ribosome maturation factor RimP [Deltaproteobacteria bacterium]